jgi:hypothetical protein
VPTAAGGAFTSPGEDHVRLTEYRVVETSTVTDEALTRILNDETKKGWVYDGMTFVPNEASKRPRLAFVIFTREVDDADARASSPAPSET